MSDSRPPATTPAQAEEPAADQGQKRAFAASPTFLTMLLLLMVAFGMDLYFFTGYCAVADDNSYLLAAHRINHGQPLVQEGDTAEEELAYRRLGVNLPLAVMYYYARGRIFWCALGFIGWHLAIVLLTFFMGRIIHGTRVGLLGAALVATAPIHYVWAGIIFPDNLVAFWILTTLLISLYLHQRSQQGRHGGWLTYGLFFVAGLTACMAGFTKVSGLLAIPMALGFALASSPRVFSRQALVNCLCLGAGALALFAGMQVTLVALGTHWVNPIDFMTNFTHHYTYRVSHQGLWPQQRFFTIWEEMDRIMPVSLWPLLAGSLIYPFMKKRNLALWLSWAWLVGYQALGSSSLTNYLPPPVHARYFAHSIPLAAIFFSYVLLSALTWLRFRLSQPAGPWGRVLRNLPAVLCLCLALGDLYYNAKFASNYARTGQIRSFVESYQSVQLLYPKLPIVLSNGLSDRVLAMFLSLPDETIVRNQVYNRHFDEPLPQPPFIFLAEEGPMRGRTLKLDFVPPKEWGRIKTRLITINWTTLGRYHEIQTGNFLIPVNPNLPFRARRFGVAIVMVEKDQS